MNFQRTLRCAMKMRSCGLFWHKAIVTLTFASRQTPGHPQQALLTIARPNVFGGKMEIWLNPYETNLAPVSGKAARRNEFGIRYGAWHRVAMLRAPTRAIYATWWTALENALAVPNYVALPIIDAREEQISIAPFVPSRRNASRPKRAAPLETVVEVEIEEESLDDEVPMLEERGPSSPTELDILASWRTWGSLDYFESPPSISSPLVPVGSPEAVNDDNGDSINDDKSSSGSKISIYSDISEFWARPSASEDEESRDGCTYRANPAVCEPEPAVTQDPTSSRPSNDDEWLDEIAIFAFRHKVGAARKSERRPNRRMGGQMHPLLRYALL